MAGDWMKKFWKTMLILLVLVGTYVLINGVLICAYSTHDDTQPADAAIVLGAGIIDGEVSPVYQERLNHALWLYNEGYVDAIIPTGGTAEGNSRSDASVAKDYLVKNGIPAGAIFPDEKSFITQEELSNAKEIMEQEEMETALVVSDPLHMKRAMFLAKSVGLTAYTSPTTTSRYMSLKTQIPFLLREIFFYTGYQWYVTIF